MKKQLTLKVKPSEAADDSFLKKIVAAGVGCAVSEITGYITTRRSIDARSRQVFINLSVEAFINEPFHHRQLNKIQFGNVSQAKNKVIIIGAGPAGLFAALQLIEKGIKPIILERGKDVKSRRRDLAV
ncbi:MAG TPA: FAD-dependent monooxygenase, partial [Chitinophagaceae bacterium]|nr:FAD-dependent monooxygenase [Chitinophagaceae bacterium]